MYKKFFGFKEKPFKLAPNPEYLFLGKSHDKVLTNLLFAISHGKKSLSITGELGTGKTTLCKSFFANFDESVTAAYISAPKLDALQLLKAINNAFSIDSAPDNTKDLTAVFYEFLVKKRTTGQKTLVLIDEAQNLSPEALEQILLLSNLETAEGKLLQIILVGQPELNDMLASDRLRDLGQRLIKNCQLAPLSFLETADYIEHRISLAAHKAGPPFDKASSRVIYEYSGGLPQLINIGCEMALVNAFNHNNPRITGATTREAIQVLTQDKPVTAAIIPNKIPILAILSAVAVSLIIIMLYLNKGQLPETSVTDEFVNKTAVPAETAPVDSAKNKLSSPGRPVAINQRQSGDKISAGPAKAPVGSEPVEPAVDKPEIPEKSLAVLQTETDETISENMDVHSVHVGSFKTAPEAHLLINNLKSQGFPSFGYTSLNKEGNVVHVVVAGKYQSYDHAKQASRRLSNKGHSNFVTKAKDSLKIPAGSGPIDIAEAKRPPLEKSLAVNKSEPASKIPENMDVHSVHVGSFKTASEANLLINNLKSQGFPSFGYTSSDKKGNTVYVVVAGKYQSYDHAKEASRSLSKKGHSNFISKAKDSLKIPAGSEPIDIRVAKLPPPEKSLAVNKSESGNIIQENMDVHSVHVGTFRTAPEANLLINNLKSLGFPSFMYTSLNKKGNTVYVVVAGKYQSYDLAKQASQSLSKKGHSNFVAKAKDSLKKGPAK